MNAKIQEAISTISKRARARYADLLANARQTTQKAAGTVKKGKGPVKSVSKLGLKVTAITHRTADKLLKQQTKLVEKQIDAFAGGLRAAADAADVRSLLRSQVEMVPAGAARLVDNARESLRIIGIGGSEIGSVAKETVAELRGIRSTAKKAAAKSTTAKKKVAAKKAPAAKVETSAAA